jgi:hypothetical protein
VNAGDKFCDYIQISYTQGYIGPGGSVIPTSSAGNTAGPNCLTIANKPYFKVFGSGISAGGHFNAAGGTCPSGATAGNLAGWNDNSTSNGNFGSSAALHTILFGNNTIKGVASGQSPTAFGASASTLSFANVAGTVDATSPSPNIGGKFGSTHCFTEMAVPAGATDPGGSASASTLSTSAPIGQKAYAHSGDFTLSAGTIEQGKNVSLFVTGKVFITGSAGSGITYQNSGGGWTKDTVPSLVIHATDDIFIDANIATLDGVYISEKTGGHIYTCASGFAAMAKDQLYNNCYRQLVVHGSFVADNVDLMRTYGSLRNEKPTVSSPTQAAITWSSHDISSATRKCVGATTRIGTTEYACSSDFSLFYVRSFVAPANKYCVSGRTLSGNFRTSDLFCENLVVPSVTPKVVSAASDCSNSNGITPTHNTCAAEVFEFSPELYLSQPAIQAQNLGAGSWNAVTSLPPVL